MSNDTPSNLNDKVLKVIQESIDRNDTFFQYKTKPLDIYFLNRSVYVTMFSSKNVFASFLTTPFTSWIVVNEDGLNVDVIAHEIAHYNIYESLGYSKWIKQKFEFPIWLDEGLACQLDNRNVFDLKNDVNVKTLNSVIQTLEARKNDFSNQDLIWENYSLSKYAVSKLLLKSKPLDLIGNYNNIIKDIKD